MYFGCTYGAIVIDQTDFGSREKFTGRLDLVSKFPGGADVGVPPRPFTDGLEDGVRVAACSTALRTHIPLTWDEGHGKIRFTHPWSPP